MASVSLFNNKDFLRNIRGGPGGTTIHGIGGSFNIGLIGDTKHFGTVTYDPKAVGNILCSADMIANYNQYKNNKDNCYVIPTSTNKRDDLVFHCQGKLFVRDCTDLLFDCEDDNVALVTVKENESKFSKREVSAAKQAREIQKRLGCPSTADTVQLV